MQARPHECAIADEMVLSSATCGVCGQLSERMLACDLCGSAACAKHRGWACRCSGHFSIECRALNEPLQRLARGLSVRCDSPRSCTPILSPHGPQAAAQMALEIRQMAKYCSGEHGPGQMGLFAGCLSRELLSQIVAELTGAGVRAGYDVGTGLLVVVAGSDPGQGQLSAAKPSDMSMVVEYTPLKKQIVGGS